MKAMRGQPTLFLTLTIRYAKGDDPDAHARKLADGWRALKQFLARKLKRRRIPYLVIFEKHKSGMPHLHLLLRTTYIDHRLIRRWWRARFNSHRIDIRRARDTAQSAFYVTKYVSKDPQRFEGVKRYWCSQDWDPPKKEQEGPPRGEDVWFEAMTVHPLNLARMAMIDGARVTFKGLEITIERWGPIERSTWGLR